MVTRNMKRTLTAILAFLSAFVAVFAQGRIEVEAPDVVALDERFNITFIIEDEKSPSDFKWSAGDDFQLVWGPQKGSSTSTQIINGKRSSSHQTTFTYILIPKSKGTFTIPEATATLRGERITSGPTQIQVVSEGASSGSSQRPGGSSSRSGQSSDASSTGNISSDDLFLRLSVSKREAVVGEPLTATLKLYQRVNIGGFENAKFPSFNGFWSQETYAPANIEFKRESIDDKIYNTATLRSYVLIPQQAGPIAIEPAELVCLVNVRVNAGGSGSIFDSFFQNDYRTIRKRVTSPGVTVKVNPLPAGQPASYGGGVGNFNVSAKLTANEMKTHDAASLIVTVSGRGNVALLEAPKVNFPPDFEVYDMKTTENTDKSAGGVSGSKTFEFPFIPRSHGDFTIDPIEYSYYDVNSGKYVVSRTEPMDIKVAKGKGGDAPSRQQVVTPGVERKGVKSLSNDIRYISTKKPSLKPEGRFFLGSTPFWIVIAFVLLGAVAAYLMVKGFSARKADVVGAKNRRATKMALGRLKKAEEYLNKNLYTAYYEELHKALLGYVSDKLNMDMSEISKDNIVSALVKEGVTEAKAKAFTDLLDACEFARYSPDAGSDAMKSHFDGAVEVISSIDSRLKVNRGKLGPKGAANVVALALVLGLGYGTSVQAYAADEDTTPVTLSLSDSTETSASSVPEVLPDDSDELWDMGVEAFTVNDYHGALACWEAIALSGDGAASLYYNIGNAYFKLGDYPRAILYYERALKTDPSHSDARYNLDFANDFVMDKIDPVPEFILKSAARKLCYVLGSDAWAWIAIALLALALGMVALYLLASTSGRRKVGFFCGLAAMVLSLCAFGFSSWQKSDYTKSGGAIVMSPVTAVKGSPSEDSSKDLFVLHEGSKVRILDEVGDWKNISLADGRQGWIKASAIEEI